MKRITFAVMDAIITSTQNKLVKQIVLLKEKSRERKKSNLFIAEGLREIFLAKNTNYTITHLLYNPDLISDETLKSIKPKNGLCIKINAEVYKKIAYRETTEGVIAIIKGKKLTLDSLNFKTDTPLILIAEAPEKPGNIGALLRTADAANLDAVIIANPKTDIYNPNIIRSSVGCVFTNTIATGNTNEVISFLKTQGISIFSATLQTDTNYTQQNYNNASAIVVGTEATGLSNAWREASTSEIKIPMLGKIDSMNVSVSAGILIYEAKRQRHFK